MGTPTPVPARGMRRTPSTFVALGATALIALLLYSRSMASLLTDLTTHADRPTLPLSASSVEDWDDITPSETLSWTPCFQSTGRFLCARLTLPMDYTRPLTDSQNPRVHIAMVLSPGSPHSLSTHRFSSSPLIVNPGGPGGSGTNFVLNGAGWGLRSAIGPDRDILGFDPRGMGASTPKADCFYSGAERKRSRPEDVYPALMNRLVWTAMAHDVGLPNSTADALAKAGVRSRGYASMCSEKGAGGEDTGFGFLGTPNVAADMRAIVGAWDEWLAREAVDVDEHSVVEGESLRGKLVFWGFSYGTFLGATFASMFPNAVGRMILDGVVDPRLYEQPTYMESTVDADSVLKTFFKTCHAAGPKCALSRPTDTSPSSIEARYTQLLSDLARDPPVVIHSSTTSTSQPSLGGTRIPVTITASDIKAVVFSAMYFPTRNFPPLATVLDLVFRRADLGSLVVVPRWEGCSARGVGILDLPDDSPFLVSCSDHLYQVDESPEALPQIFNRIANASQSFADVWTNLFIGCPSLTTPKIYPPTFNTTTLLHGPPLRTSNPILLLSTSRDPVTPLRSAARLSARLQGSSLLEIRSEGHCSLSSTSFCALRAIRKYLDSDILPKQPVFPEGGDPADGEWEVCEVDAGPWRPIGSGDVDASGIEDVHAWGRMHQSGAMDEVLKILDLLPGRRIKLDV